MSEAVPGTLNIQTLTLLMTTVLALVLLTAASSISIATDWTLVPREVWPIAMAIVGVITIVIAGLMVRTVSRGMGIFQTTRTVIPGFWRYTAFFADFPIFFRRGQGVQVDDEMKGRNAILLTTGGVLFGRICGTYLITSWAHFQLRHVISQALHHLQAMDKTGEVIRLVANRIPHELELEIRDVEQTLENLCLSPQRALESKENRETQAQLLSIRRSRVKDLAQKGAVSANLEDEPSLKVDEAIVRLKEQEQQKQPPFGMEEA